MYFWKETSEIPWAFLGRKTTNSRQGVAVDYAKVNRSEEFLGLTRYYRKFIQGYRKIAKPSTELTKMEGFNWRLVTMKAFQRVKDSLTTALVLSLADFTQPFQIECDASGKAIGAVLMQHKKPIAYS
ncbi:putative mitochondrial protein, partial [Mucuna pruriens]